MPTKKSTSPTTTWRPKKSKKFCCEHPVLQNLTAAEQDLFETAWDLDAHWKERTIAQVALIDIVQRHHVVKEKIIYTVNNKQPLGLERWKEEHCPTVPCR